MSEPVEQKPKRTRRTFPTNLVGKKQAAAEAAVVKKGLVVRSVKPGEMVTLDLRGDRVTLDIDANGIVTGASLQ